MHMPWNTCGDQRTAFRRQVFPPTCRLSSQIQVIRFDGKHLHLLSNLTDSSSSFYFYQVWPLLFFYFLSSLVFYFMPSNMSNFFSEYQWATSREQNRTPSERAHDVVPVFQFDELYPSYKKGNMCYRHVPSVSSLLLQPWWQWVVKLLNLCLKSLNPFSKSRKLKIKERLK